MRRAALPALALVLAAGACSSDGGSDATSSSADDTATAESTPTNVDTPEASDTSETDEPDAEEPTGDDCTRFSVARTKGLADGARRGVTVGDVAYGVEVGDDANGYLAVALTVTKDGKSHDVVVATPVKDGDGLTLATDPALPFLNWGDMAAEGTMVDDVRDAVGNSHAAQEALDCL